MGVLISISIVLHAVMAGWYDYITPHSFYHISLCFIQMCKVQGKRKCVCLEYLIICMTLVSWLSSFD